MGRKSMRWAAVVLAASAVAGCCQVASIASLAPDMNISALLNTAKQTVDALDVVTTPDSSGCSVSVTPSAATALGRELYFALDYDPATQHAVGLGSGTCGSALCLAVEPTPGH